MNKNCVQVTHYITDGIDKRSSRNSCFIDLKKAFDMLYHRILFNSLGRYGFRVPMKEMTANYLAERWQNVIDCGRKFMTKLMKTGVFSRVRFRSFFDPNLQLPGLTGQCSKSKTALFADVKLI